MTTSAGARWFNVWDGPLGDVVRDVADAHGQPAVWLVVTIYVGCLLAFITDLQLVNTLAFGVFYTPLVTTAIFYRDKRAVIFLTGIACALDLIGAVLPNLAADISGLLMNRTLSLFAIVTTGLFIWRARLIQDQLAEQTLRAENAERIKTEVLTNLSQEIRAPLYSMMGVLELVAAEGRAEQRAALNMVRGAGRRLATTVDNLVDLTQLEGQALPPEPIDLGMIARQVAEAHRADAQGRQIQLKVDIAEIPSCLGHANPWAVRRILENLIGDAIAFTAPGGCIEVKTKMTGRQASALVLDPGSRPLDRVLASNDAETGRLLPSVMGLALSQRLARGIGATLSFSSPSGAGTVACLILAAET